MRRHLILTAATALISGCGLGDAILSQLFGPGATPETGSAKLIPFASEQELTDYFSGQLRSRNTRVAEDVFSLDAPVDGLAAESSGPPGAAPTAGDGAGSADATSQLTGGVDFSQTTIQVEGVDEPDVVKTDGQRLYIIDQSRLRIVDVSDPANIAILADVELEGFGSDIFLHGDRVIALTQTGGGFFFATGGGRPIDAIAVAVDGEPSTAPPPAGQDVAGGGSGGGAGTTATDETLIEPGLVTPPAFERPRTIVTVINVSTPSTPVVLSKTAFDGSPSASRMIDGVLHLVISNFQNFFVDVFPALGRPELDTGSLSEETVLPGFSRIDADGSETTGNVVTWREMFRPTDPDGFGIVTLVSLDVDADAAFSGIGVVAEPGLVFSSLTALYLTDTEFNFSGETRETTDIYKFAYQDRGAVAAGTGSVPGRVLNQFSMGEFNGRLHVATTTGPVFTLFGPSTGPSNNVYVLEQTGDSLAVVGSVEDLAPGETIQSARFIGDRGFLVTFERIDPLFTLDMSDPSNPRVVGELKVPGFSTFITPIDADHLLTVGQFVPETGPAFPQGVQLSIFDISDFANPTRTANVILGEGAGSFSEAVFNPKAFAFFAERGLAALPVSIPEGGGFVDVIFEVDPPPPDGVGPIDGGPPGDPTAPGDPTIGIEPVIPPGFDGLVVFNVSAATGLTELGRISTRFDQAGFFGASFTRGVFILEDVFAVTNQGLRGAPLADMTTSPFELVFETNPPEVPPRRLP
ncbi:MAG: beta-propeller domain-containing protein [Phycisphaerae bacterium]